MLAGLILAGGASRRMGEPKALLDIWGETFVDRLIRVLGAHCDPVVVVLGHEAERVRAGVERAAEFVINPAPGRGQLSSMQCGLRAVPGECDGVMFTPVDYPAVKESTVAAVAGRMGD
ncbi:MAG: NTP transferase domain-containing protein, partial [bacterium]|nr:NTP transferase domain-containing protein [bacterium]